MKFTNWSDLWTEQLKTIVILPQSACDFIVISSAGAVNGGLDLDDKRSDHKFPFSIITQGYIGKLVIIKSTYTLIEVNKSTQHYVLMRNIKI